MIRNKSISNIFNSKLFKNSLTLQPHSEISNPESYSGRRKISDFFIYLHLIYDFLLFSYNSKNISR